MTRLVGILKRIPLHAVIVGLCILWVLPTFGLLVTSVRPFQDINESGWWTILSSRDPEDADRPRFTLNNYRSALVGYRGRTPYAEACLTEDPDSACTGTGLLSTQGMGRAFLNSILVAIPATILPVLFAAFAAKENRQLFRQLFGG